MHSDGTAWHGAAKRNKYSMHSFSQQAHTHVHIRQQVLRSDTLLSSHGLIRQCLPTAFDSPHTLLVCHAGSLYHAPLHSQFSKMTFWIERLGRQIARDTRCNMSPFPSFHVASVCSMCSNAMRNRSNCRMVSNPWYPLMPYSALNDIQATRTHSNNFYLSKTPPWPWKAPRCSLSCPNSIEKPKSLPLLLRTKCGSLHPPLPEWDGRYTNNSTPKWL